MIFYSKNRNYKHLYYSSGLVHTTCFVYNYENLVRLPTKKINLQKVKSEKFKYTFF